MDRFLWILIGLGAGTLVGGVAPSMRALSLSDRTSHRIRVALAGVAGAFVGGFAFVLYQPDLRGDGLTTALAALAGALWVSGITEVTMSRRRRGEEMPRPDVTSPSGPPTDTAMPAYDAARLALVEGLTADAATHDAGRYEELGRQFAATQDAVARQAPSNNDRLRVALRFWRDWIEARDNGWRATGSGESIGVADWPGFARVIAADLALDRDTTHPTILARFADASPVLD